LEDKGAIVIGEEVGRIRENLRRPSFAKLGLGKAAAEQADRLEADLSRGFRVVGRIADHDSARREVQQVEAILADSELEWRGGRLIYTRGSDHAGERLSLAAAFLDCVEARWNGP
jgi:hypothetical protein